MTHSITGRIARPVAGSKMRRINQVELYELGEVARLRVLRIGDEKERCMPHILRANFQLERFRQANSELLPQSAERAGQIMSALGEIVRLNQPVYDQFAAGRVKDELDRFGTTLEDELARLPTFMAEPVGAYSFGALIGEADRVFPAGLRGSVIPDQVLVDFKAAGACLAFDQGTACAFHAFRATDAMLRAYCAHFNGKPKGRDWGKYLDALREILADIPRTEGPIPPAPNLRTINLLNSIRAEDRNPLIHPELNLGADEALMMFDLCKNAISLMAEDVK